MDPKYQLTSDNNYTPSKRASRAMSSSQGQSSRQVAGDAPSKSQATESRSGRDGDMPKQSTGGKPPAEKNQGGTDKLDNARSFNDEKA